MHTAMNDVVHSGEWAELLAREFRITGQRQDSCVVRLRLVDSVSAGYGPRVSPAMVNAEQDFSEEELQACT